MIKIPLLITQLYILLTSWWHNNYLKLPMLFIAHTAVALSDNTFIWVCLKWLYKLLRPNKTALSTKTTCKGAIGIHLVQSLHPWFFLSKIATHLFLMKGYSLKFVLDKMNLQYYLSTIKCPFSQPVKLPSFCQNFLWKIWIENFVTFQWPAMQWAKTHYRNTARKFT